MHDLEEGNLQNTQPPQIKKICKYFNEGICSHESNHGQYKHYAHIVTTQMFI